MWLRHIALRRRLLEIATVIQQSFHLAHGLAHTLSVHQILHSLTHAARRVMKMMQKLVVSALARLPADQPMLCLCPSSCFCTRQAAAAVKVAHRAAGSGTDVRLAIEMPQMSQRLPAQRSSRTQTSVADGSLPSSFAAAVSSELGM